MLDLSELVVDYLGETLKVSLRCQAETVKSTKRGTQHWACQAPALLTWMDSASTSSESLLETGSIADSDLRDVDLELAVATAPTQVVQVSIHQSSVKESPAIDAGQAPTMVNVITVPQFAQLITYAHAPPLGITSNQLLLSSASTTAPLLVTGPTFPPVRRGPISMLPGAPIARNASSAARAVQHQTECQSPALPYSAMHSA